MALTVRQTFDSILQALGVASARRLKEYSDSDIEAALKNNTTLNDFMGFLYQVFDNQNLLLNSSKEDSAFSVSDHSGSTHYKFLFTEEYPDSSNQDIDIVTQTISRRSPSRVGAGSEPFSGVGKIRPHYLGETQDIINGGMIAHFLRMYDNEIHLLCWSKSTAHARIIAETIESLLLKFYPLLRSKVDIFRYIGRGATHMSNDYGSKRLTCIPLTFFCRTSEWFCIKQKELDSFPELSLESIKLLGDISYE